MGQITHLILDIVLVLVSIMKIVGGDGKSYDYFTVYGFLIIAVWDMINMIIKQKKARERFTDLTANSKADDDSPPIVKK